MAEGGDDTTRLLDALGNGDPAALDRLLPVVYRELRIIAERQVRRQPPGQTVQPTMLVHDVFMKLAGNTSKTWEGRSHFLAVAAKAMRDLLVDSARRRLAQKRGGGLQRVTLSDVADGGAALDIDVLDLEDALRALAALDERQAKIIELRFYAGLSVAEVADVLQVSERTVMYDWRMARAWLRDRLGGDIA